MCGALYNGLQRKLYDEGSGLLSAVEYGIVSQCQLQSPDPIVATLVLTEVLPLWLATDVQYLQLPTAHGLGLDGRVHSGVSNCRLRCFDTPQLVGLERLE